MEIKYTYKDRHDLYLRMIDLTDDDVAYVMGIIKMNGDNYSRNSNGCFFDLRMISDRTLEQLIRYFNMYNRGKCAVEAIVL